MLKDVPQFVPQKVCLSCDGCCRFKEHDSQFRPKLVPEEIEHVHLAQNDLTQKIFSKAMVDEKGYVRTSACLDGCHCTFFNGNDNTCSIYKARPFECQLYPLLLIKKGNEVAIGVHLFCPYIQEKKDSLLFEDYLERIKEFFTREEVLAFLRRNPSLAGDYDQYQAEIKYLFTIAP